MKGAMALAEGTLRPESLREVLHRRAELLTEAQARCAIAHFWSTGTQREELCEKGCVKNV